MGRFIYRLPPCWEYDIEGIQSWLEELHAKGLVLDKDGYVFGFMQFQRGEPQRAKYRLEAIQKVHVLKFPDDPDEKTKSFYDEFGWEYLGQFRSFYIYRTCDPAAPEMNTDPAIQAMSLNALKKRTGIFLAILLLTEIFCIWVLGTKYRMISTLINEGWLPTVFYIGFMLAALIACIIEYLHISRLHRKLNRGEPLQTDKNWRKGRILRRIALIVFLALWFAPRNAVSKPGEGTAVTVAQFQGDVPFVTMADMAPEREYVSKHDGMVRQWSDLLSPVNYLWAETASLEAEGEKRMIGNLEICYHETKNEWIAKALFSDYISEQEQYRMYTRAPGLSYGKTEADNPYGFDQLEVYESIGGARLFIRSGTTVVKVSCSVQAAGESGYLYPLWLELMAKKMA